MVDTWQATARRSSQARANRTGQHNGCNVIRIHQGSADAGTRRRARSASRKRIVPHVRVGIGVGCVRGAHVSWEGHGGSGAVVAARHRGILYGAAAVTVWGRRGRKCRTQQAQLTDAFLHRRTDANANLGVLATACCFKTCDPAQTVSATAAGLRVALESDVSKVCARELEERNDTKRNLQENCQLAAVQVSRRTFRGYLH